MTENLFIFAEEDLQQIQRIKKGMLITPLKWLAGSGFLVMLGRKLGLRKLLANPLKNEFTMRNNDKYWKYGTLNFIWVGTFGLVAHGYYRWQISKLHMFRKYEQQVGMYMHWRLQTQTRKFIKSNP